MKTRSWNFHFFFFPLLKSLKLKIRTREDATPKRDQYSRDGVVCRYRRPSHNIWKNWNVYIKNGFARGRTPERLHLYPRNPIVTNKKQELWLCRRVIIISIRPMYQMLSFIRVWKTWKKLLLFFVIFINDTKYIQKPLRRGKYYLLYRVRIRCRYPDYGRPSGSWPRRTVFTDRFTDA